MWPPSPLCLPHRGVSWSKFLCFRGCCLSQQPGMSSSCFLWVLHSTSIQRLHHLAYTERWMGMLTWRSPSVKRVSRKLPRHLRTKPSCQAGRTTLSESLVALNLNVSTFPPTKRNTSTVSTAWLWVVMDVGSRLTWDLKGFRAKMLAVGATPGWRGRIGKRQLEERHCPSEGSCGRNTAKSLLRNHKNAP